MKKKTLSIPILAIIWRDACCAQNPDKHNIKPPWVVDCGFVVKEDKDYIVLVRQFFDDGQPRHAMTILKDNIEKVQHVGVVRLPSHFMSVPFLGDSEE